MQKKIVGLIGIGVLSIIFFFAYSSIKANAIGQVTVTSSFTPEVISANGTTVYRYNSTGATHCRVTHPDGTMTWDPASLSFEGTYSGTDFPNGITTTITCDNGIVSASSTKTLTVVNPSVTETATQPTSTNKPPTTTASTNPPITNKPPVILTSSFTPEVISPNGTTVYRYNSTGATHCRVTHPDGTMTWDPASLSFEQTYSGADFPNGITTTVTCDNGIVSVASTKTLTVVKTSATTKTTQPTSTNKPPVTTTSTKTPKIKPSLTVISSFNPEIISADESSVYSYTSTGANYCQVTYSDGKKTWDPASYSFSETINGSDFPNGLTITVTCDNGSTSKSSTKTLTVKTVKKESVNQIKNIVYKNDLKLDLYNSFIANAPTVVLVHGGGWFEGKKEDVNGYANYFFSNNINVVNINYTLASTSSQSSIYPMALQDLDCALRWVAQHSSDFGFNSDNIQLVGASAGAHLSLLYSLDQERYRDDKCNYNVVSPKIKKVVSLYAPTDLKMPFSNSEKSTSAWNGVMSNAISTFLNRNLTLMEEASPINKINAPNTTSYFLFHAKYDEVVPFEYQALPFYEKMLNAKYSVQSKWYFDNDHLIGNELSDVYDTATKFIKSVNESFNQPIMIDGICGSVHGMATSVKPFYNLCTSGQPSSVLGSDYWNWTCNGSDGGRTTYCFANKKSIPVNGTCGTAIEYAYQSAPFYNLCLSGTAGIVNRYNLSRGAYRWMWMCYGLNNGTSTICSSQSTF